MKQVATVDNQNHTCIQLSVSSQTVDGDFDMDRGGSEKIAKIWNMLLQKVALKHCKEKLAKNIKRNDARRC